MTSDTEHSDETIQLLKGCILDGHLTMFLTGPVIDSDLHRQICRQIILKRPCVGILVVRGRAFGFRLCGGIGTNSGLGQLFRVAHRKVFLDHAAGQCGRILCGNQGASVTGGQFTLAQIGQNLLGQIEQTHGIGDVATAFAQDFGQFFLCMADLCIS